jgi:hypothetical protein
MLQWLKGIEDDQITINDKLKEAFVSPSATIKDVNALLFNGTSTSVVVDDGVQNYASYHNDFVHSGEFIANSLTSRAIWASTIDTDDRCNISLSVGDEFTIGHFDGNHKWFKPTSFTISTGVLYKWRWEHGADGAYDRLYINDTLQTLVAGSIPSTSVIGARIGRLSTSQFFDGVIANVSIEGLFDVTMQEGIFAVAYDKYGSDGVILNGTWGTSDLTLSSNHFDGHTLYEIVDLELVTIPPLDLIPDPSDVID